MDEKSFEENMSELQTIVEKLENGDVSLDDAIAEYQQELDGAGYQDILAAAQQQYADWKAEQ